MTTGSTPSAAKISTIAGHQHVGYSKLLKAALNLPMDVIDVTKAARTRG